MDSRYSITACLIQRWLSHCPVVRFVSDQVVRAVAINGGTVGMPSEPNHIEGQTDQIETVHGDGLTMMEAYSMGNTAGSKVNLINRSTELVYLYSLIGIQ